MQYRRRVVGISDRCRLRMRPGLGCWDIPRSWGHQVLRGLPHFLRFLAVVLLRGCSKMPCFGLGSLLQLFDWVLGLSCWLMFDGTRGVLIISLVLFVQVRVYERRHNNESTFSLRTIRCGGCHLEDMLNIQQTDVIRQAVTGIGGSGGSFVGVHLDSSNAPSGRFETRPIQLNDVAKESVCSRVGNYNISHKCSEAGRNDGLKVPCCE